MDMPPPADPLAPPPLTPEEATARFCQSLERLHETQSSLARRMRRLGDPRGSDAILRSIQRMATGEVRIPGEMMPLLELMRREDEHARDLADKLVWVKHPGAGAFSTSFRDFTIKLLPQSQSRWLVDLTYTKEDIMKGYSPSWPEWQPNLEVAKVKAVLCVKDAEQEIADRIAWEKGL